MRDERHERGHERVGRECARCVSIRTRSSACVTYRGCASLYLGVAVRNRVETPHTTRNARDERGRERVGHMCARYV